MIGIGEVQSWLLTAPERNGLEGGATNVCNCAICIPACAPHCLVLYLARALFSLFSRNSAGSLLRVFCLGSCLTLNMSNARYWEKCLYWARHLLGAIKGMGSSDGWPDLLGNDALNLGVCPCTVPTPNLQDPEIYLVFFARTLDIPLCTHLARHPLSAAAKLTGKKQ